jgi:hypothetical protein
VQFKHPVVPNISIPRFRYHLKTSKKEIRHEFRKQDRATRKSWTKRWMQDPRCLNYSRATSTCAWLVVFTRPCRATPGGFTQ